MIGPGIPAICLQGKECAEQGSDSPYSPRTAFLGRSAGMGWQKLVPVACLYLSLKDSYVATMRLLCVLKA